MQCLNVKSPCCSSTCRAHSAAQAKPSLPLRHRVVRVGPVPVPLPLQLRWPQKGIYPLMLSSLTQCHCHATNCSVN
eukprot:1159587-Pelagomonas_calceolata.AAC.5